MRSVVEQRMTMISQPEIGVSWFRSDEAGRVTGDALQGVHALEGWWRDQWVSHLRQRPQIGARSLKPEDGEG